jgi:prepilin-type N-terminal cleavage/methylation domain-containing protein
MSAAGDPPPCREAGFTLFEALVALAIMGLAAGIAFPALTSFHERRTVTEARTALLLALAEARATAHHNDLPAFLVVSGNGRALRLTQGGFSATLPQGAQVALPASGCGFMPDGGSNGCTISLTAGRFADRFTLDPTTSQVEKRP